MPRDKSSANSKSSLRRSLRPRRSDKANFQVGDVVEVSYKNGIEIGTLICQVTSDRWIVKYKNNNMHEQQMSEKSFGQIIHRSEANDDVNGHLETEPRAGVKSSVTSSSLRKVKRGRTKNKSSGLMADNHTRGSSSSIGTGAMSSDGDSHHATRSSAGVSSSAPHNKMQEPVLSAREKRMRMRREAIGADQDEPQELIPKKKKKRTKARDGYDAKHESSKEPNGNRSSKKEKEEVVKVKLNTGTLYLYRGMNPRAVFMRRY